MSTITSNNPNPLPGGFLNTGSNIGQPRPPRPLELGTVIKAGWQQQGPAGPTA